MRKNVERVSAGKSSPSYDAFIIHVLILSSLKKIKQRKFYFL